MYSRCLSERALAFSIATVFVLGTAVAAANELRVCADPDNLPYSHENGSGFENRIAELVAADLGLRLTYTWLPHRRGFIRKTLNAEACDVVIGVPTGFELVRTTQPYYRSTYVFVQRAEDTTRYLGFADPALASARIGVQLIGDDGAMTPPGYALAIRGMIDNVVGYPIYGERPQAERMIDAVSTGELDVALVWGPQAAHYAGRARVPLVLVPAYAPPELEKMPFEFPISIGVRRSDVARARALEEVLARRRSDIDAVLRVYGIPRTDGAAAKFGARSR
jgi:quinoprotein dehydrogenase-associated probable ABC transporter substrate-binding protein